MDLLISDPVDELVRLGSIVSARNPKSLTSDEAAVLLRLVDRILVERPDYLDTAEPDLLLSFFRFRRRVHELRRAHAH